MRVLGQEVFGPSVEVGEVAPATSGDEDLFAWVVGVIEQDDAATALPGLDGAHQPGGTCSDDDGIYVFRLQLNFGLLCALFRITAAPGRMGGVF